MPEIDDNKLKKMVKSSDRKHFESRLKRLEYLVSISKVIYLPYPTICIATHEEARLCWYNGAFIASIVMTQLTFEELLRSYFRMSYGISGELRHLSLTGKIVKCDSAGFYDLIQEAFLSRWLSSSERENLHKLRKIRNNYVHIKDISLKNRRKESFHSLVLKLFASELVEGSLEEDAQFAVTLLRDRKSVV